MKLYRVDFVLKPGNFGLAEVVVFAPDAPTARQMAAEAVRGYADVIDCSDQVEELILEPGLVASFISIE